MTSKTDQRRSMGTCDTFKGAHYENPVCTNWKPRAAAPAVEDDGPTAAEVYRAGKYAATRGEDATPRILFQSAVSGLKYERLEAAGDICAVWVDGREYRAALRAAPPQDGPTPAEIYQAGKNAATPQPRNTLKAVQLILLQQNKRSPADEEALAVIEAALAHPQGAMRTGQP